MSAASRLSVLLLGLACGGMAVIAAVLAPWWAGLPPAEFRAWFTAWSPRIRDLMVPLGGGATIVTAAAVVLSRGEPPVHRSWLVVAALGATGVMLITVLCNEPLNARFVAPGALGDAETTALLARWRWWHHARLGFGIAGFYAAVRALEPPGA
jgi:hypothetical protein